LELVSTVVPPTLMVFTPTLAAAVAETAGLLPPDAFPEVPDEPHAASAAAPATAAAGSASRIRRALRLLPRSRIFRVAMTSLLYAGYAVLRTRC
jgi:hypothetical protein